MVALAFCVSSKFRPILAFASKKGERMFELEFNGSHQKIREEGKKPLMEGTWEEAFWSQGFICEDFGF